MNSKKIWKFVISLLIFLSVIFAIVFFCTGKDMYAFACILFIFILIEGYGQFNAFVGNNDGHKTKSP